MNLNTKSNRKSNSALVYRAKTHVFVLTILTILLFSTFAFSSNSLYFKQISSTKNLSSNYVNDIIRRNDGFVWLATSEGINRYDGNDFVTLNYIPHDPASLPSPFAKTLLEDHLNQLWVGTENGLARLLPDERHFENYQFSPDNNQSI